MMERIIAHGTGLRREAQLRALSGALARRPEAPLQELAELAGVSRRTVYRIAESREALIETLKARAMTATREALDDAGLGGGDAAKALDRLTRRFLADSDVYAFLTPEVWRASGAGAPNTEYGFYRQTMVSFFERGQTQGVFESALPSAWLAEAYDQLLVAASNLQNAGLPESHDLASLVLDLFLKGAERMKATLR